MTTEANQKKPAKGFSDAHIHQITILKSLAGDTALPGSEVRPLQITEIAEVSGLKDEKEVQRYLFILEGQKLVSPQPEGDFTSKTWCITRHGVKALKSINKTMIQ